MIIKNWRPSRRHKQGDEPANGSKEFVKNYFDAFIFVFDGSDESGKSFVKLQQLIKAICDFEKHKI